MVLDALDALVARGAVDIQYLEPLSDDEVQVMARSSGAHAVAERLGAAEGVPLYVEELMDAPVGESVPRSMLESVRQRVNALGADAVRLLGGAALLGRRFDWQLLARGLGCDDHTLVATSPAAAAVGLLDVEGVAFRFRHALTRDAILGDLVGPDRVELAAALHRQLVLDHPELPGPLSALAADLAIEARAPEVAAGHLIESARRAIRRGAPSAAVDALAAAASLEVARDRTPSASARAAGGVPLGHRESRSAVGGRGHEP